MIRDHSAKVSEMLGLPQRVIPVAGMTVGWPSEPGHISPRLSLSSTVHEGQYDDMQQRQDDLQRTGVAGLIASGIIDAQSRSIVLICVLIFD